MKRLVLTFDDGPNPSYTPLLLDVLKQMSVQATFFVVAKDAFQNKVLIERMQQEEHEIALHSYEHRHAFLSSYKYTKNDFSRSMEILAGLNCNIKYYRPPWGARNLFTRKFVKQHGLHIVLWDIMTGDWKTSTTPEMIADKIKDQASDGAVICLHDGGESHGGDAGAPFHTIEALKTIIPELREKDYEFVTVKEYFQNG